MKFLKQRSKKRMVQTGTLLLLGLVFAFPPTGACQTNTAKQAKQAVEKSIQTRQKTQKQRDQWETEKSKLVFLYEQLQQEHATLVSDNHDLTAARQRQDVLNRNLLKQLDQNVQIPFQILSQNVYRRNRKNVFNQWMKFWKHLRVNLIKLISKKIKLKNTICQHSLLVLLGEKKK